MSRMNRNNAAMFTNKKERMKFNPKTAKRLLSYLKSYKLHFLFVLVCIVISSVTGVVASLFLKTLIDGYIMPLLSQKVPDYSGLLRIIMLMACIYAIGALAALFYNRMMANISQGVLKNIRDEMFSHMQTLGIKYFDTHTHGDIMSYYTNDTDTLRQMISQSIPQAFSSIITVTCVFCAMLTVSVWLTLFAVLFLIGVFQALKVITGRGGSYFVKQQRALADVNGYIEEMINGQKVVKVFCHEEKCTEGFDERNDTLCENQTAANSFANILMPLMNNFGYLLYVLIAIVGGGLAIAELPNLSLTGINVMTLGMIASFLQLSRNFLMPISQISQQLNAIISALAGAERIFDMLDEPGEQDNGYVTLVNATYENGVINESPNHTGIWAWKHPHSDGSITYTKLEGDIVLDHVDFSYTEGKQVLNDVCVYARPGQKVAFVGATGAGKTTITNLINRFYDIDDGKIRYDGININKIKKTDLRRSLGIVLQDVNLFTGTIMENLKFGNPAATDEQCIAAAKLANAHSFIEMLPQKYDTVIAEGGSNLSQGQRQLISIARAAVADPPVMILDEATSSIDTRTETIVQRGMDSLMKGRTVFVIAHRLSTVKNSDVIIVLDHGSIIERGSHDELIAKKGIYYRLYTGAFELS